MAVKTELNDLTNIMAHVCSAIARSSMEFIMDFSVHQRTWRSCMLI